MNIFKTISIFIVVFFLTFSIVSTAKETEETDYSSENETSKQSESASEDKPKFEYNKTYGPSPIFTIGGGFSGSPGGWALTTRIDMPYKDDLYIGPVGQFVKGNNQVGCIQLKVQAHGVFLLFRECLLTKERVCGSI